MAFNIYVGNTYYLSMKKIHNQFIVMRTNNLNNHMKKFGVIWQIKVIFESLIIFFNYINIF